jgi:hypothetical protein
LEFHYSNHMVSAGSHQSCQKRGRFDTLIREGLKDHLPGDIGSIENCKTNIILIIGHIQICFEIVSFGIPGIRTIQEGTEEEES